MIYLLGRQAWPDTYYYISSLYLRNFLFFNVNFVYIQYFISTLSVHIMYIKFVKPIHILLQVSDPWGILWGPKTHVQQLWDLQWGWLTSGEGWTQPQIILRDEVEWAFPPIIEIFTSQGFIFSIPPHWTSNFCLQKFLSLPSHILPHSNPLTFLYLMGQQEIFVWNLESGNCGKFSFICAYIYI